MRRSWTSGWLTIIVGPLCAFTTLGCNSIPSSGIDPTGEHVFAAPVGPPNADRSNELYRDDPLGPLSWDDVAVQIQPHEMVASVGSEVVLTAGVCGADGYLRMNRRLEWSIAPGSVGQFVAVEEGTLVDMMLGDFNRPRKITNTFAIGSTSRINTRLNRGTCNPETNVYVLRGQGWISLTSPVEGTSHVTVVAPEVYSWDARTKSAMVHWVDAQWRFPPPAINPAGTKHVFTTTVVRQSNQSPCERWLVRYEIADGPPAGFAPTGAQSVEVPTDSTGQASAEIIQKEPKYGINKINIQVIRPADALGANGQRLLVGSGTTTKTWTGADLSVKTTGPSTANVGDTLTYRIDVSNPGDLAAKDLVATDTVPDGLAYLGSNPPAQVVGRQLQWRFAEIGGRQSQTIQVQFRSEKQGSVTNCCEVTAGGGLKVSDCATTTVTVGGAAAPASPLDVRVTNPAQAALDSEVKFEVAITNLGQTPAAKLRIRCSLDLGLENPKANLRNVIDGIVPDTIASGASKSFFLNCRVTKSGQLCNTIEVSGEGIAPVTKRACVTVRGGTTTESPAPSNVPPLDGAEPRTGPTPLAPSFSVEMTCAKPQFTVGEKALFTIKVKNNGTIGLQNLRVFDRCDPALNFARATDGHRREGDGLAWTIENVAVGKSVTILVECSCQAAAAIAYNRVSVTAPDAAKAEAEASVQILAAGTPPPITPDVATNVPADKDLKVSVAAGSPVFVGKELTYVILLENTGMNPYRLVSVTATVPDGMVPYQMGTVGPEPTTPDIKQQVVRFTPVSEIRPGASLKYFVKVGSRKVGKYQFRVEVSAPALTKPLVQEAAPTEVIQEKKDGA